MAASASTIAVTIPFDRFWTWLQIHPNCILRAGTPEVVLFDDEDLHWHFATEQDGALVVQLIRGKRSVGEMIIAARSVEYVQSSPEENGEEFVFDLFTGGAESTYHFVLSHGYDAEEPGSPGRWIH